MEKTDPAGTILIVDDEQSLLSLIERTLRREEFQIVTQSSGAEAISWLNKNQADLMLLDLNLLDMSGQDVINALAKKNQSVPFIVITGHDDVRVAVEIMKMGAVDYLVKGPDFLGMLPVVVHRVMAQLETRSKLAAAEAALQESEERYRNLVELSPEVIFLCCEEKIVFMNQAGLRFFGAAAPDAVLGRSPLDFVHPDYRENQRRIQGSAAAGKPSLRQEHKWVRLDGTIVDAEVTATSSKHKGKPAIQVVARDISERKRLEKQILDISELEQRRIAEDLHDGLCQNLAGIQLMSQVLEQKLAGRSVEVAAAAAEIAKLVRQSIAHTRDLVKGLSPVLHYEEGLVPALRELAEHTEKTSDVSCVFKNGSMVRIPDQTVATHLYRIAQEAVNNSIKHGKAKRIVIDLISAKDRTILSLRDDGIGFPRKVRNHKGVGLQIMTYRASMIGGTLTIQPETNGGTAVICSIQRSETGSSNPKKAGL